MRKKLILKHGTRITFTIGDKVMKYTVRDHHLRNLDKFDPYHNKSIFHALGIDAVEFATKHYGYSPNSGVFPECKYRDIEALTRITRALQDECNKFNYKYKAEEE